MKPSCQARKVILGETKDVVSRDLVEGILEVYLQDHKVHMGFNVLFRLLDGPLC